MQPYLKVSPADALLRVGETPALARTRAGTPATQPLPGRLCQIGEERVTLVLGGPRSGTTWLAKIFDSHPDVLYRHEPDTVLRDWSFPGVCPPDEIGRHVAAARRYLHRLIEHRSLKSAGSLPIFVKSFQTPAAHRSRGALVWGLRGAERLPLLSAGAQHLPIPDLIDDGAEARLRIVIKSVSSCGRARLFAEALPGCRIIFILRNPFGQVASMLRGAALGKLDAPPLDEVLATDQARGYGLTARRLAEMPLVERLAWHWAVLNETAVAGLSGLSRARIVRYLDLAGDPLGCARSLFDFAGLEWHSRTGAFIAASSSYVGPERYFQIFRDGSAPADRWRRELSPGAVAAIRGVLRQTTLRSFWPEADDTPAA